MSVYKSCLLCSILCLNLAIFVLLQMKNYEEYF